MTVPSLATIPTFGRAGFSKQGTVVAPTTFVEDAGVGTALTNLSAHTGEKGATWALTPSFTGAFVITDANRIRKSGTTSAAYHASGTPATANYDFEADFVIFSLIASDAPALVARVDSSVGNTYIRAQYAVTAGQWQFADALAGSATSLGTFADTPSGTVHVKIQCRGTTAKLFLDGVERASGTTAVTAAGVVGVRNGGGVSQSNSTGVHFDNIVGTNA